jgi:hypothetical protein
MATQTQQDQPQQDPTLYTAFVGLRNDVDPERFSQNDLAIASNIDIDRSYKVTRRPGYTSVYVGACHSVWSDEITCLMVVNSTLVQVNADYSRTVLRTLADGKTRMVYCKVNDRIYFSNGTDKGIYENGVCRSWGMDIPGTVKATATVGYMPAGEYQFTMTYLRSDGQESGSGLASVITVPAGSGLIFSLPVSHDPDVVSKALYLSTPNSNVMYLALLLPNATTVSQYTNDTLELDLPLVTQFLSTPPAGQLISYYRGHILVAKDDYIYISDPFGYELFDLRKNIATNGRVTMLATIEDVERIMMGGGLQSGVFVGTDVSCGVLAGTELEKMQYVLKTDYGVIEGALAYVDGSLFGDDSTGARPLPIWLSTDGICVGVPGMDIKNLTRTRYQFKASGKGAALFMPASNKLILTGNL